MKFPRIRPMARSPFRGALFLIGLILSASTIASPSHAQGLLGKSANQPVTVEILDVGQGDSILIRSPEGKTALIDAGPTKDTAARLLKRKGLTSIDLVVVSHHHSDHYGGMEEVIRTFKPRYFLASQSGHTTKLYLKLLKTVEAEGITAIGPTSKPRKIELGSIELTILPQPPENPNENENSIGIRLRYGNFSVLMTGDSEGNSRGWWLKTHPELLRDCTILKLAHHGSHNGTDTRWLQVVKPELTVASLGKDNSYGHPHEDTLSLLQRHRIPLLRTDQVGTITIESDGREWKVAQPTSLARPRRSKLTQDDIDRVVSSSANDEESPTRSTRSKSTSGASSSTRKLRR